MGEQALSFFFLLFLLSRLNSENSNAVSSVSYSLTVNSQSRVDFATRPHTRMSVGEEYLIECKGSGGVPSPELVASVGPSRAEDSEEDMILEAVQETSDGLAGGVVQKLFKYFPNSDYR